MVGRDDDLERLIRMVDDPATRLVTITGRGGVGKTRLALAAAEVLDRRRPGSVVFVDLAPLTEPGQVLVELAGALGAPAVRGASAVDAIAGMGRRNRKLVILDNMEHLVDSGAGLAELLGRSPTLRLLVTSQKPLRLRAEHVLELGALPVPPERPLTTGELARNPAVQLFVARAEAADPSFHLTDGGAPSVAALCRALEGLPLAIELAAVPSASVAPADLQDRLGSGALLELPAASADVPPRQASLRSALEWTTGLLDDGAHSLLGALAVLASPFDLRDAVDLADADAAEAERSLWQLTELHLVERLRVDGRVRFRLADSVREFALQELDRSTRRSDREERAIHWLAGRARRAAAGVDSTEESSWRSWLAEWHSELVRATRAALRLGLVEEALELLTALCPYWRARGPSPADIDLAAAAVSAATALGLEPPVLAEVLVWIGLLGLTFGDPETWPVHQANLERGESLARAHDDRVTLIRAVGFRALSAGAYAGDYAAAAAALEEGTALAQAVGSRRWLARFTLWSAMLAHQMGDDDRAAELGLVALLEARRQRDGTTEVLATTLLSPLAPGRSSVATELPTLERALELARANGQFQVEVSLLAGLALAQLPGRPDRAASWCAEALDYAVSLPIPILAPYCVLPAVQVLSALGDDSGAAELQGAFAPTLEVLRFTFPPEWLRSHDAALERVRRHLGDDEFDRGVERGARLDLNGAARVALAALEPYRTAEADPGLEPDPDGHPSPSSSAANPLTERQTEVVRLIAEGLTNPEIAAKLGVSVKTVGHHASDAYLRLGIRSRSEAAAWAVRAGLVG